MQSRTRAGAVRIALTLVIFSGERFCPLGIGCSAASALALPPINPASAAPRESWFKNSRRFINLFFGSVTGKAGDVQFEMGESVPPPCRGGFKKGPRQLH